MDEAIRKARRVAEIVRSHAQRTPDALAVADVIGGGPTGSLARWSYAELDRRARQVAVWLRERYAPGSRVMLLYPVHRQFVAAFVGCLYAGVVPVVAPPPGGSAHNRRRLRVVAADAAVAAVLTDSAGLAGVREWAAETGLTEIGVLATDQDGFADPADHRDWWSTVDTLALLQYTSGSTGDAKGVMVTNENLLANARAFAAALGWRTPPRFGGWLPMFHDMGLVLQLVPALLAGSATILMPPSAFVRDPWVWLDAIGRYGITCSAAPNFAFDLCLRRIDPARAAELDLSGWDYAINASEPVRLASMTDFAKRFAVAGFRERSFVPLYGLAECTVFTSATAGRSPQAARVDAAALAHGEFTPARSGQPARTVVSCGAPVAAEVRVADPRTGAPLPPGRVGEIWLRGPSVTAGYWHNEDATRRVFRATAPGQTTEFLRTGDLGVHHDGELYITGRLKEVLIVRGRNLYPHDIEHELRAHHPELGNVGAAFCVPAETGEPEGEPGPDELVVAHEVREVAPARLAALASAMKTTVAREFGVSVRDVLLLPRGGVPRTSSGKIERSRMREQYLAGAVDAVFLTRPRRDHP